MNEFNLTLNSRIGKRDTYTTTNDEQLSSVVREILRPLPDAGESYVISACRQRNIFVQHQRMRDAVNNVYPVSRALRRSICIIYASGV